MIDNRTQVFDVAMKNARTIEACLDRLAMMGADHQLKLIAGRLSRLTQCAERRSRHDQLTNAAALAEKASRAEAQIKQGADRESAPTRSRTTGQDLPTSLEPTDGWVRPET